MTNPDKAIATQMANIEKRTGKTLAQLTAIVKSNGLSKHGELVKMLKTDLGLNVKGLKGTDRLQQLPAGKMCNYNVKLTDIKEVNAELIGWIKAAYEAAG